MQWHIILSIFTKVTFYANALRLAVPIALTAIGEVISERAGVVNIGLEGLMMVGALSSVYVAYETRNAYLGLLVALALGVVVGLVHAGIAVHLAGDQIVDGVGLNMFARGIGVISLVLAYGMYGTSPTLPPEARIPSIGAFSPFIPVTVAICLVTWYVFNRTSWGLRLRAAGEDPVAAEAAGINVFKLRTLATVVGSVLASASGVFLGIDWLGAYTRDISAGRGFIALALVVFSRWNPLYALLGGLIFGFAHAFSLSIPSGIVPDQLLYALPYLITLLISAGFLAKARAPASVGKPYKRA